MTIETELPAVKVKPLSDYRIPGQCNCGDCLHIRQEKDALTLKDESIERFSPEFQARFKKMEEWAASLGDDPGDGGADEIIALRTRCAELVKALGFYADEKNWSDGGLSDEDGPNVLTLVMCSTDNDRGEIARAALASHRKASDDLKEAEGVEDKWRPIETAPREDEDFSILAYDETTETMDVVWLSWLKDDCRDVRKWYNGDLVGIFTHWMPLPPAPAARSLIPEKKEG